jgi:hypothetical protein
MAFSSLRLDRPAIYLDTDMIVLLPCDPRRILGDKRVILCKRSFGKDDIFNPNFRGMNLSEYQGMSLNDVYPYIACSTVTESYREWEALASMLDALDPKFKVWYGDQEALKVYAQQFPRDVGFMPESVYGCLPEFYDTNIQRHILHFKGERRKLMMKKFTR